jgi:HSP90 family molecular chaperone
MVDNRREHIERIRDDFQASQRVKDSLNNSIQALARDLYSKDTHFIFELIQNAEDNSYQKVEPSLSFRLSKTDPTGTQGSHGALIIHNNEIGFSSENVEAICAVGKTTKSKLQGYIGEKGIGFKSVFRVTSIPHIFSNG